jgi:predicted AAA+ superfamily ATPase
LVRKIPAFARFLDSAAFSNGEIVNHANIARECGVSLPTVQEYFHILEDTLLSRRLPAYQARPKRRVIRASKFFFFDLGLANFLLKRERIALGGEAFGKAFEHLVFQELTAHSHYSGLDYPVRYWRTASGFEVDFILGDQVGVEVKGVEAVASHHLRGLRALLEERRLRRALVVSLDPRPRRVEGVEILPWKSFFQRLWGGELVG